MIVFTFDANEAVRDFQSSGLVHAKSGVSADFLEYARPQQDAFEQGDGSKVSFREMDFALPDLDETLQRIFDVVATVGRLDRARMTLAECQLKGYFESTPSAPTLHKDRLASEIAIGIPLRTAPESRFVAYPDRELEANPFSSSREWHRSLDPARFPQVLFDGVPPLELDVRPGAAVLFRGSRIYHGRSHGAGSTVLYLKLNALRLDPHGVDPSTRRHRKSSVLLFDRLTNDEWFDAVVDVSPRLTEMRRVYTRDGWQEIVLAVIHGERDLRLSEIELRIVRALPGPTPVRTALRRAGVSDGEQSIGAIRRLVRFGVLDLIEPSADEQT